MPTTRMNQNCVDQSIRKIPINATFHKDINLSSDPPPIDTPLWQRYPSLISTIVMGFTFSFSNSRYRTSLSPAADQCTKQPTWRLQVVSLLKLQFLVAVYKHSYLSITLSPSEDPTKNSNYFNCSLHLSSVSSSLFPVSGTVGMRLGAGDSAAHRKTAFSRHRQSAISLCLFHNCCLQFLGQRQHPTGQHDWLVNISPLGFWDIKPREKRFILGYSRNSSERRSGLRGHMSGVAINGRD